MASASPAACDAVRSRRRRRRATLAAATRWAATTCVIAAPSASACAVAGAGAGGSPVRSDVRPPAAVRTLAASAGHPSRRAGQGPDATVPHAGGMRAAPSVPAESDEWRGEYSYSIRRLCCTCPTRWFHPPDGLRERVYNRLVLRTVQGDVFFVTSRGEHRRTVIRCGGP